MSLPTEESIKAIIGHEFPGGDYLVAHWENFLLTECTGADLLPNGLVHPVVLFHMPILGAGTSIKEMFDLGQATSEFSIGIESYEWEIYQPLKEDISYRVTGRILDAERQEVEDRIRDRIQFQFDIHNGAEHSARSTIIWHYNRGAR